MKVAAAKTIERIEREFHRRAFGDERARVNALPAAERRAYLARLRCRTVSSAGGNLRAVKPRRFTIRREL
jgi:hypothetical protein